MQPPDPPPVYQSPLPLKKVGPAWPLLLVGCLGAAFFGVAILAAILFPVFAKARDKARAVSCMGSERQMSLALMQYAQDFDMTLPRSAVWMDKIQPYVADEKVFHCPTVHAENSQSYGYAFDSRVGGKSMAALTKNTVTLYDSTNLGRNATDAGTSLPSPGRHGSSTGNVIAYGDGHVKFVQTERP